MVTYAHACMWGDTDACMCLPISPCTTATQLHTCRVGSNLLLHLRAGAYQLMALSQFSSDEEGEVAREVMGSSATASEEPATFGGSGSSSSWDIM